MHSKWAPHVRLSWSMNDNLSMFYSFKIKSPLILKSYGQKAIDIVKSRVCGAEAEDSLYIMP